MTLRNSLPLSGAIQHKLRFAAKRGAKLLDQVVAGWAGRFHPETVTVRDIGNYILDYTYRDLTAAARAAGMTFKPQMLLGAGCGSIIYGAKFGFYVGSAVLSTAAAAAGDEVLTRTWRRLIAERRQAEAKRTRLGLRSMRTSVHPLQAAVAKSRAVHAASR